MKRGDIVMVMKGIHQGRVGWVRYIDPVGRIYVSGNGLYFSVKKEWAAVCEGNERKLLEDWLNRR